jgi:hypothetical protein
VAGNTIPLMQAGLIKCIIDALDIGNLPINRTPAAVDPLVKDENLTAPSITAVCSECSNIFKIIPIPTLLTPLVNVHDLSTIIDNHIMRL